MQRLLKNLNATYKPSEGRIIDQAGTLFTRAPDKAGTILMKMTYKQMKTGKRGTQKGRLGAMAQQGSERRVKGTAPISLSQLLSG